MNNDILLSSKVSIKEYLKFEEDKNQEKIADFIMERFTERYITPIQSIPSSQKNGFCIMAISCLMIEAIESFWKGWPDTKGKKGRQAFASFFERCSEHGNSLGVFLGLSNDFYDGVRNGLLHQAETKNGWRIIREGPVFSHSTKTINATRFHKELNYAIVSYCETLRQSDWDSDMWNNLRNKMESVIKNCQQKES